MSQAHHWNTGLIEAPDEFRAKILFLPYGITARLDCGYALR
jgi:hypothetical protein